MKKNFTRHLCLYMLAAFLFTITAIFILQTVANQKSNTAESRDELREVREKLESNQQSQDKKIADNEKEIADLKRFKCINLSCNNRKQ